MTLSKTYNPKEVESKIYALWEKSGFFNPDKLPKNHKKTFSIVIPPPNVTGSLHMGHALNGTVQDIIIRQKRMAGYQTLWLPGTDHAGIATQNVMEKELKKQGKSRHDLGREEFLKKVWEWKEKYGNIILDQFKKIGCSCDWSRNRFTMDKDYEKAVLTAFEIWYKKGWIYKGDRVINWCPRCASSLSDLELEYEEEKGSLWYIKYPLVKNSKSEARNSKQIQNSKFKIQNCITVATTRPETMLGDTAVAVNPKDKRYKDLVGEKVILPLVGKEIPIIADEAVDKEFGTGALKVTPAHDMTDFEIGQRHKLETIKIINEQGKIIAPAPLVYQGLPIKIARQKIVEDLEKQGFLEKIEPYQHSIAKCYRCNTLIESLTSKQWFVKMDKLAELAIKAVHPVRKSKISNGVKSGEVKFHPKRWEKTYLSWLKNIKDWCISRQLWWGHKIPIKGETDVLDTWFSSALWPFATLGWPQKTNDLKKFYPTNLLSTGRDIINLWVSRMIFSGLDFIGEKPFSDIYIHPTVLTKEGKRMSKSLGTGTDPLELIEKYGADATRFGISWQITEGQDIKFVEDNMVMGKKLCNKIWNASRFVLRQIGKSKIPGREADSPEGCITNVKLMSKFKAQNLKLLTLADKKILKSLEQTIKTVNKDLEKYYFGSAAHKLYEFFWHDFCDVYIEDTKCQMSWTRSGLPGGLHVKCQMLLYVLLTSLKLLHPFIPFITEEIYQKLPIKDKKKCLMIESWPS